MQADTLANTTEPPGATAVVACMRVLEVAASCAHAAQRANCQGGLCARTPARRIAHDKPPS
ncbi:MAG TPA: hypothetical protein VHN14_13485 [Kofleriaceae bacterium]|nr:hypothetical protein [Kofleriaceae bacterium]